MDILPSYIPTFKYDIADNLVDLTSVSADTNFLYKVRIHNSVPLSISHQSEKLIQEKMSKKGADTMCEIGSARDCASSRNHPRNELPPKILRTLATYSRSAATWLRQVANSSASAAMDRGLNPPSLNTYLLPSDAGRSRGSIPTLAH
jgi:hypothetical protein